MKTRINSLLLFLLAMAAYFEAAAGTTPRPMLENVEDLSAMQASVSICMESDEFKSLPVQRSVVFFQTFTRIDNLVKKIAQQYDDNVLLSAHLHSVQAKRASPQFRKELVGRFGSVCGAKAISEVNGVLTEAEQKINSYFRAK